MSIVTVKIQLKKKFVSMMQERLLVTYLLKACLKNPEKTSSDYFTWISLHNQLNFNLYTRFSQKDLIINTFYKVNDDI